MMTPGRAVLVRLIEHYLAGLTDPLVALLEIHKLACSQMASVVRRSG
jgi:hypothetical protein